MFDLKVIHSVLDQLEEERGIPRATMLSTIEAALATAYKKEYGKRGQDVRATFDLDTGTTTFYQVKRVVDETLVRPEHEEEGEEIPAPKPQESGEDEERPRFDSERHIWVDDARRMKRDAQPEEEMVFPLESRDDFGRIAAQTAKQVIIQKIREAEKASTLEEYGSKEGEVVSGTVQRVERGNIFIDLGRTVAIMPYDEQIPGERFRQGERVRAYLYQVEESPRGVFLRLSRSHPEFLKQLFAMEAPELANGSIEISRVAREPGARSKIAVFSHDEHIDPVGSLVGQRGVRVSTVMSELGGEKIDIIEWSEEPERFIEDALSPAKVLSVALHEEEGRAEVEVAEDQQSLAIGRGGQNVRLAAKLTGWKIDIKTAHGEALAEADEHGEVEIAAAPETETPETPATEAPAADDTPDEKTADAPETAEDAAETTKDAAAEPEDENEEAEPTNDKTEEKK